MTTAEWTADAINMLLIVLIVCVSVAGIFAVKGFIEERMLRKRSIRFTLVFGFLFMVYLVVHVLADLNLLADWDALSGLREILPSGWAQIFLVLGLVGVTGFYALMAFRQANASVKMAEEMRNARSPSITMQWGSADPNNRKIDANLENEGFGPALNLKCYLTHKEFDFNYKFGSYTTFKVGQKYSLSLPSENFDFKAWNGLSINCDYESILGGKFRSILRCESEKNRSLEIIKLNSGGRND